MDNLFLGKRAGVRSIYTGSVGWLRRPENPGMQLLDRLLGATQ